MKTKVIRDASGAVINIGEWDYQIEGQVTHNPLPEGAYEDQAEVVEAIDGGRYPSENYRPLRAVDYPSIGDQLDALFRAGLFPADMAAQLTAVKEKYPKPT